MPDQYTNPADEQLSVLPEFGEDPETRKKITHARNWLYVIAAMQVVVACIELFTTDDETLKWVAFGIDMGLAVTFAGLALYTNKKPFIALLTALIVYGCAIIFLAASDPMSLTKGVIIKVFFIVAMVKGIKTAREAEALQKLRQ